MTENGDEIKELLDNIKNGIFEKKGERVVELDFRAIENRVCDYFIICHGNSFTHVDSIAEEVELKVKKNTGEYPHHREGLENCLWVLIDYGNVVVHIFQEEYREFYNLESLWADAITREFRDN